MTRVHGDGLCVHCSQTKAAGCPLSGRDVACTTTDGPTHTHTHQPDAHHPSLACKLPRVVAWQVAAASCACPGRRGAEPAPALPAAPGGLATLLLLLPAADAAGTAAVTAADAAGAGVAPGLRLRHLASGCLLADLLGRADACSTVFATHAHRRLRQHRDAQSVVEPQTVAQSVVEPRTVAQSVVGRRTLAQSVVGRRPVATTARRALSRRLTQARRTRAARAVGPRLGGERPVSPSEWGPLRCGLHRSWGSQHRATLCGSKPGVVAAVADTSGLRGARA